jgi:hypothetical protein
MVMKKRNVILIIAVVVLLVAVVGIFAYLNTGNIQEKKKLEEGAIILVKSGEKTLGRIDMNLLEKTGIVEFSANLDTSNSGPEKHSYSGVLLGDLLTGLDIDINNYNTVIAKAIDGYTVAYNADEVSQKDNIYVAIKMDGKDLGTKSTGGKGPYQLIVKLDQFSQRWCKFVIELELK